MPDRETPEKIAEKIVGLCTCRGDDSDQNYGCANCDYAGFITAAIKAERERADGLAEALREIVQRDPIDAMNHGMTFSVDNTPSDVTDVRWQLAVARAAERGTNGAKRIAMAALEARTDAGGFLT